jgi:hypothetical protein
MNRNLRFFAERRQFGRTIALHLSNAGQQLDAYEKFTVAQPVSFVEVDDDQITQPMLEIHQETAQRLMDELWNVGFRPTQGKQSEGQVAATERHLDDMRAIAFAKLEVPKP